MSPQRKKDVAIIKNSKWMPCDSHETTLASDWLTLSFQFQHGKNEKETENGGR